MVNILVIADTHINPSQPDLELWTRLGEYCVKTKPDFIVHLGDVGNFDSQAWLKAARGTHTLEEELEVVKEKIEDAKRKDDNKAKYDLMRIEHKLENDLARIKYNLD